MAPADPPTQTRIFQAARALFDQGGADGVSMRRIANKVGITPMAIYKHYADKDALLSALMLDGFASWEARVDAIGARDPLAWLESLNQAFLDFALDEPRRYEAAFLLKASQARQYPRDFAAGRSPVVSKMQAQLQAAQAKGVIADLPVTEMALTMAALNQGLVAMYRAGRFVGEEEFRAAYRAATRHCFRSFLKEPR
ncbi:MAG TPA: TetR/AcrR family transcriptional regulator [Rhizomicrobium sp.]|nr:TetR/AcrR family transcriptional regulator [Rhizomicrobium sp.]